MWNLFAATFAAHRASAQQRMLLLVSTSDVEQHGPRLCKAVRDLGVDFICIPERSRWALAPGLRQSCLSSHCCLASCHSAVGTEGWRSLPGSLRLHMRSDGDSRQCMSSSVQLLAGTACPSASGLPHNTPLTDLRVGLHQRAIYCREGSRSSQLFVDKAILPQHGLAGAHLLPVGLELERSAMCAVCRQGPATQRIDLAQQILAEAGASVRTVILSDRQAF